MTISLTNYQIKRLKLFSNEINDDKATLLIQEATDVLINMLKNVSTFDHNHSNEKIENINKEKTINTSIESSIINFVTILSNSIYQLAIISSMIVSIKLHMYLFNRKVKI